MYWTAFDAMEEQLAVTSDVMNRNTVSLGSG